MKLKELKEIINGIDVPIDRIAGFCDNYVQMFDTCSFEVDGTVIRIGTYDGISLGSLTIAEVIASLQALTQDYDNHDIVFTGVDNQDGHVVLVREVYNVKILESDHGTVGLSFQGRERLEYRDDDLFITDVIIEDKRAKSLNSKFFEFIEWSTSWHDGECEDFGDEFYVGTTRNGNTIVSFISEEKESEVVTAIFAGMFNGVYFCRTPLTTEETAERTTNDNAGKYWKKFQTVYFPAISRYYPFKENEYRAIADNEYCMAECDTDDEMEQFISNHNPDPAIGDFVQCISTSYIDNPLDYITDGGTADDLT